jgi:hypothetical protein
LRVLIDCISEIKEKDYITTTPITFRTILDALKHCVPDDTTRRPLSSSIFHMCCSDGQLDNSVLEALERVQPELYAKLPSGVRSGSEGLAEGIPPKWTRNVRRQNR